MLSLHKNLHVKATAAHQVLVSDSYGNTFLLLYPFNRARIYWVCLLEPTVHGEGWYSRDENKIYTIDDYTHTKCYQVTEGISKIIVTLLFMFYPDSVNLCLETFNLVLELFCCKSPEMVCLVFTWRYHSTLPTSTGACPDHSELSIFVLSSLLAKICFLPFNLKPMHLPLNDSPHFFLSWYLVMLFRCYRPFTTVHSVNCTSVFYTHTHTHTHSRLMVFV